MLPLAAFCVIGRSNGDLTLVQCAEARREMYARKWMLGLLFGGLLAISALQPATSENELSGFAIVQKDSSMKVAGNIIYLYGIYVPPTMESCYTFVRPLLCGPRASIALEFKISGNFVHCTPRSMNPDGSLIATCSSNGEDLSAWMLQSGWALALPGAPAEYQTRQSIAQAKGVGIWGIPVDSLQRRYGR
jgi:endonuclease YncB( thermonuclease family)